MTTLHLHLLGNPQILLDSQPITIKSRKARAILFYVAMADAPVARAKLVGLLWPDSAEKTARSNLRTQLATLRKTLGDHIEINRQTVTLAPTASVDARSFTQKRITHTDQASLRQQLALYQGTFLSGFSVGDSAEYAQWQLTQGEYLHLLAIEGHQRLVTLLADQPAIALPYAREWVNLAPLQEAAHRAVISLLTTSGNRAEAIQQYHLCVQLLDNELGVAPTAQTQALYQQLLAENPPTSSPIAPHAPAEDQNRRYLLDKIRAFWLDGVLRDNVPNKAQIALQFDCVPEEIVHPWGDALGQHFLQPKGDLLHVFARGEQQLLILGAPGAGKSISLLSVTQHLWELANSDPSAAIPVVLHLAAWATQRLPLGEWIVAEMKAKYQIPLASAEILLSQNALLPLLDGLDEMTSSALPACITAINQWRDQQARAGLVVCCRSADYTLAQQKLHLNSAIRLQPLTRRQIDRYLAQTRAPAQLRANLLSERHSNLHELAQSPMLLSLLREVGSGGDNSADHSQLIAHYVDHAFQRKPVDSAEKQHITQQLGWLARHMRDQNQAQFLLEALQPSWLDNARDRLSYLIFVRLFLTLATLITFSITIIYLWYRTNFKLELQFFLTIGAALTLSYPLAVLLGFTLLNIPQTFFATVRQYRLWERWRTKPQTPTRQSAFRNHILWETGIIFVWVAGIISYFGDISVGLALALIIGMAQFGSAQTWLATSGYRDDIQQIDKLGWSWRKALLGVGVGLLQGGAWFVAIPALNDGWDVPATMVLFTVVFGLQGVKRDDKIRPNRGTWLALRNGLMMGLLVSLLIISMVIFYDRWQAAVMMGLALGISGFLFSGGINAVKHAILRGLLARSGHPLNLIAFLDQACTLGILQRVGGGYVFRHRLILDYFADEPTG